MNTFRFWTNWLQIMGLVIILCSLAFPVFFMAGFDLSMIDSAFWTGDVSEQTRQFQGWIYGEYGAAGIGFGLGAFFIARYAFAQKQKWAWIALLTSFTSWYTAEGIISTVYNIHIVTLSNTPLYILMILPLGFTFKSIWIKNDFF